MTAGGWKGKQYSSVYQLNTEGGTQAITLMPELWLPWPCHHQTPPSALARLLPHEGLQVDCPHVVEALSLGVPAPEQHELIPGLVTDDAADSTARDAKLRESLASPTCLRHPTTHLAPIAEPARSTEPVRPHLCPSRGGGASPCVMIMLKDRVSRFSKYRLLVLDALLIS